jgi:hypothetical protein
MNHNPFLSPPDPLEGFFPYETIDFDTRLEVMDRQWRSARYIRRQRIRFRQDGVATFLDFAWGDGVLFAYYHSPANRIIDTIPTRKGYVVVLGLSRTFYKGETLDVMIERKVVGPFFDELNFWESLFRVPTQRFTLDIVAPSGASFRDAEVALPPDQRFDAGVRGRMFQLRVNRPSAHAPYRLSWRKK